MDLNALSDDELVQLQADIAGVQDSRKPLDPEPWCWPRSGWSGGEVVRNPWGPQNDGRPYPNGTLSQLLPRRGYRQNRADYEHTRKWKPEDDRTDT